MLKHTRLQHRFVQYIPDHLEPGVIYISMNFGTAVHCCCCGCGEQVVTPFSPYDWKMTFDGETISLWPSIGNWKFDCRSHYIVSRSRIIEAEPWEEWQQKRNRSLLNQEQPNSAGCEDNTIPFRKRFWWNRIPDNED